MLALTRRKGESIVINENIEIVVLGIQGEQVKLGIVAPKNVAVHRKEVFEQIRTENVAAAAQPAQDLQSLRALMHRAPKDQPKA